MADSAWRAEERMGKLIGKPDFKLKMPPYREREIYVWRDGAYHWQEAV